MLAAGNWYTSSTVWAAAGVVATVLTLPISVLTVIVTNRTVPKRWLIYGIKSTEKLPANDPRLHVDLNGSRLETPYIQVIRLTCRGRQDIPSNQFDQGFPLEIDVGSPNVELIGAASNPASMDPLPATVNGTILEVGPGLIKKDQTMTFTLLMEGRGSERLDCWNPLIDVNMLDEADTVRGRPVLAVSRVLIILGYLVGFIHMLISGAIAVYDARKLGPKLSWSWVWHLSRSCLGDYFSTSERWAYPSSLVAVFLIAAGTLGLWREHRKWGPEGER